MRNLIFLLTISLFAMSCGQTDNKQKELELKERELALKEKELGLRDSQTKSINGDSTIKSATSPTESSFADIKVQAYLIYRTGKLSSFDVLNDKSKKDGLFNTIIGEGVAEDWSDKTKLIITGTAKNVTIVIKNAGKVSVNKKNINISGKEEYVISNTGCDELTIKVSSAVKVFYSGKILFSCGE
ncbi:MAG: hypothetical protein IPP81_20050 [Chitinophagaceae bacterium]|nr:hypothetical protein [Chitinophagaceae bacterium]